MNFIHRIWTFLWEGLPLGPLRQYNLEWSRFIFSVCPWTGLKETYLQVFLAATQGVYLHILTMSMEVNWDASPYDPGS